MHQDTICALATANGMGAIGIIRVSGSEAIDITNKIFSGQNLHQAGSHTVHYGYITDGGEKIDEVMVSIFRAPRSFTTEDSTEISFHGSPFIAKRILEILTQNGARIAKAGEFTMRAFTNGRIDLAQAESIADLIAAENEAARKVALNQLKGGISAEISGLRAELLNFTSLIELELDFAEEDVEFADRSALKALIRRIKNKIEELASSFKYGNAIKNGIAVAIVGKPNAGKSTLLNALLKEERAIVSDIAGTTRDTIEEILYLEGNAFRFIDTAGIRETLDQIEAIGVEKTMAKMATADIVLFLFDERSTSVPEIKNFIDENSRSDLKLILVQNKADLYIDDPSWTHQLENLLAENSNIDHVKISAKESIGLDELKKQLLSYLSGIKTSENNIISNQRHFSALQHSLLAISKIVEAVNTNTHTELLAYELRYALESLGEISGDFTNDEVLGNIFSKFCIGK